VDYDPKKIIVHHLIYFRHFRHCTSKRSLRTDSVVFS